MLQPLKRVLCLLLAAALLLPCAVFAEEAPNPTRNPNAAEYDASKPEDLDENQLTAWSALVMEESTGDIIFEKDIDMILYPASTTKIMTVLLGIECCDLDEIVTTSWNAVNIGDPDATMLGLDEGEEMRMEDLLYGTLMRSGNDGAIAIAEHVSGSVEEFVRLMNETAYNLGMTNTHFMNPHGLHDPNHYTSAYDIWKHVAEHNLHLRYGLYAASANDLCRKRIDLDARDYSTLDAMAECEVPVLFVHGTDDSFVPISMTYENYKACAAPKRLLVVPGAEHATSWLTDRPAYGKALVEFWESFDQ